MMITLSTAVIQTLAFYITLEDVHTPLIKKLQEVAPPGSPPKQMTSPHLLTFACPPPPDPVLPI
eukprot:scaffold5428_cov102-Amphora_coffeaeformis.AAC.1